MPTRGSARPLNEADTRPPGGHVSGKRSSARPHEYAKRAQRTNGRFSGYPARWPTCFGDHFPRPVTNGYTACRRVMARPVRGVKNAHEHGKEAETAENADGDYEALLLRNS